MGAISSLFTKILKKSKSSDALSDTTLIIMFGYLTYFICEYFHFAAPLAIVVYAFFFVSFGWHNLSHDGKYTSK